MDKTTSKEKSNKLSFSPMKGNKYKNFLTSILSPSTKKRHSRQKLGDLHTDSDFPVPSKSTQQSNESIYSSIEDVKSATCHRKSSFASDVLDSASSAEITSNHERPNRTEPQSTVDASEDPVYAVVHKPPLKPKRKSFVNEFNVAALQEAKENNKLLVTRMKEISEENCRLKKQLQCLEKQDKMKESALHGKLQLEITQLEAETRKEVRALSERISMLAEEKSLLNGQLDLVHAEKREVQAKYDSLLEESSKKVDLDFHSKTIAEYRRLLEQAKQKYNSEVIKYKEDSEALEDAKKSLESSLMDLKEKLASTEKRVKSLSDEENKVLNEEKKQLQTQLADSRQIEEEHQKLLLSLLNVTETLAVERDILLNKASFQDNQQKELQTSVVGYSLNVGRLQEHITNLSRENVQELLSLHSIKTHKENVHKYYDEQLDILREKIMNQNNTIIKLEGEKRLLELQLENRWESYCS